MNAAEKAYRTVDKFDTMLGQLQGLPDVAAVRPTTVVATLPLIGAAQTYIIQTMRQREKGDTIFLQYIDDAGSVRIIIPPEAADAIARQREALTTKNRKRSAKERAADMKARGIQPGFMRNTQGAKNAAHRKKAATRKAKKAANEATP